MTEEDLEEYVVLTHGDLGTGEKISNLQQSCCLEGEFEDVPKSNRLTQAIFIPGLFHMQMAGAEAVWRGHIEPTKPTKSGGASHRQSLFVLCAILRPKEVLKLSSKNPGFRLQHTLINHVLAASILLCWKKEVNAWYNCAGLEEWMARKPSDKEFEEVSEQILDKHVAPHALLHAMTTEAMRSGDIGRVEELLMIWVNIWKGTQKHKYASHVTQFLLDLNETWDPCLAHAIQMNWLVIPLDGHTHSEAWIGHIIKQSPLIEFYSDTHKLIESDFHLLNRTMRHPPKVMTKTLGQLQGYMEAEEMLTVKRRRKLHKGMAVKDCVRRGG
ncbi:hypothetical protein BOTBODRAFT_60197 [Botryobasidium botryosum FD-172 SS1]|uniref:DUF6589 domain-containing protein n=1 Tax=Botryobasidium botryosum (strain FD-172 SS1) TaxID=930990 RepID=A0A067LXL1_BOTB1|nr:hypothetical protein BOTBODRAFT_60197 [Botryobasidium botryosum FD-172 SS1]